MDIQTSKFNGVQEVPSKEDTGGLETEQVYSSLAYGTGTPPPTHTHTQTYAQPMYEQAESWRINRCYKDGRGVER